MEVDAIVGSVGSMPTVSIGMHIFQSRSAPFIYMGHSVESTNKCFRQSDRVVIHAFRKQ